LKRSANAAMLSTILRALKLGSGLGSQPGGPEITIVLNQATASGTPSAPNILVGRPPNWSYGRVGIGLLAVSQHQEVAGRLISSPWPTRRMRRCSATATEPPVC
jgi:hypothetical protein